MNLLNFFKINNIKNHTLNETLNQLNLWPNINFYLQKYDDKINEFKKTISKNAKYIICGSGTSEFVGNISSSILNIDNFISISATDLITNPKKFLNKKKEIVLILIARSGNSPESICAFNLVSKIKNSKHVVITCNENGNLFKESKKLDNSLSILLPSETNDKSFAMTSSFSCLLITSLYFFAPFLIQKKLFDQIVKVLNNFLNQDQNKIINLFKNTYKRIVVLGSNDFKYFAQEASLKILELSGSKCITTFNSYLGFRHGPKAIIDSNTLILCLRSQNNLERKYENDLIQEIIDENQATIFSFDNQISKANYDYINFDLKNQTHSLYIGLTYIFAIQISAIINSINLKINPDNPFPNATVNRVVKGVKIYYE